MDLGAAAGIHERITIACSGLSCRELANRLGINHETVRRYLHGAAPSVEFIANLAEALDLSAEWLVLGQGPMYRVEMVAHALEEAGPQRLLHALGKLLERAYQHAQLDSPPRASATDLATSGQRVAPVQVPVTSPTQARKRAPHA
jgi:transcriptional regulator with XRE-family HTH domain